MLTCSSLTLCMQQIYNQLIVYRYEYLTQKTLPLVSPIFFTEQTSRDCLGTLTELNFPFPAVIINATLLITPLLLLYRFIIFFSPSVCSLRNVSPVRSAVVCQTAVGITARMSSLKVKRDPQSGVIKASSTLPTQSGRGFAVKG